MTWEFNAFSSVWDYDVTIRRISPRDWNWNVYTFLEHGSRRCVTRCVCA